MALFLRKASSCQLNIQLVAGEEEEGGQLYSVWVEEKGALLMERCHEFFEEPTGSLERPILGLFSGPQAKAQLERLKPLQRHDIHSKLNELLF